MYIEPNNKRFVFEFCIFDLFHFSRNYLMIWTWLLPSEITLEFDAHCEVQGEWLTLIWLWCCEEVKPLRGGEDWMRPSEWGKTVRRKIRVQKCVCMHTRTHTPHTTYTTHTYTNTHAVTHINMLLISHGVFSGLFQQGGHREMRSLSFGFGPAESWANFLSKLLLFCGSRLVTAENRWRKFLHMKYSSAQV